MSLSRDRRLAERPPQVAAEPRPGDPASDPVYDGAASIAIGVLLICVAVTIGLHARDLLLGQSASRAVQCELVRAAAQDPLVQAPPRLATMHLGPEDLLVVGDLAVPAGISVEDARRLAVGAEQRMRRAEPSVGQVYLRFDPDGDAAVDERND